MSALVTPHLPTATPAALAASATPAPASPSEAEFSSLLGGMNPSASSGRGKTQAVEAPGEGADAAPPAPASTLAALQSLEAALSGIGPLGGANAAANSNPAQASVSATANAESQAVVTSSKSAAPLSSALAAVGGQSAGAGSNASAQTTLRTQLQNDPSLGLRDFEMKTFLAAADTVPARSGATALHAESSWSPFGATWAHTQSEAAHASRAAQPALASPSADARLAGQLAVADRSEAAPVDSRSAGESAGVSPLAARVTTAGATVNSASAPPAAAIALAAKSLASAPAPPPIPGDRGAAPSSDAIAPVLAGPHVSTFAFSASGEVVPAPRAASAAPAVVAREAASSFAPSGSSAGADIAASATTVGSTAPASTTAESPRGAGKAASPHRTAAAYIGLGANASSTAQAPIAVASRAGAAAGRRGAEATTLVTSAAVSATSQSASDSTSAPAFTVALADLPNFIADQAGSLSASAASPDAAPATNAAANPSPKAAEVVKELQISLDPADLGAMTLKLRLAGGKLSVTISVANPQTLAAIKDDSALIAQRLGSDQALDDLVIQQQNLASTAESAGAHPFANDSSAQNQPSDAEPQARRRPNASSRGASDSGGAFHDLTV
jgi:hypothetical protein